MKNYKVFYKRGLHAPMNVTAENEVEAKNAGLAAFRYDQGFPETVDQRKADDIIQKIVEI